MGSWAHGMFSCCHDLSTCCIASFVPCVTFGQTAEMSGQGSCCCYGLLAFVPCLSIFLLCQQRGIIREKEDIPVSWNTLFFIPKLRHPSGFQFFLSLNGESQILKFKNCLNFTIFQKFQIIAWPESTRESWNCKVNFHDQSFATKL